MSATIDPDSLNHTTGALPPGPSPPVSFPPSYLNSFQNPSPPLEASGRSTTVVSASGAAQNEAQSSNEEGCSHSGFSRFPLYSHNDPVPDPPRCRARKRPAPSATQSTPQGPLLPLPDFSAGAPGGDEDGLEEDDLSEEPPRKRQAYSCHVCHLIVATDQDYERHLRLHYDYACTQCTYTTNTKGRLDAHVKKCHGPKGEKPPPKPARPKTQTCKGCGIVCNSKEDFWDHQRAEHIRPDKLLTCDECKFVTEHKHHWVYHLRNHRNSKPFHCEECNYVCTNRSMLNSHRKSHSNVHQYRCRDCSYSTKFSHSLKTHCENNDHEPAVPLNPDGSIPDGVNIEEAGLSVGNKRRAPRGPRGGGAAKRRRTTDPAYDFSGMPQGPLMSASMAPSMVPLQFGFPFAPPVSPSMMAPNFQYQGPLSKRSLATATVTSETAGLGAMEGNGRYPCPYCYFRTATKEDLRRHLNQEHWYLSDNANDRSKMVSGGRPSGKGDSMLRHPGAVASIPPSFMPQQPAQPYSRDPPFLTTSENPWAQYCAVPGDEPNDALQKITAMFGGSAGSSYASRGDDPLDLSVPKKPEAALKQDDAASSDTLLSQWSRLLPPSLSHYNPTWSNPPFIHGRTIGEVAFPIRVGAPHLPVAPAPSVPVTSAPSVPVTSGASEAGDKVPKQTSFRSDGPPLDTSPPATTSTPPVATWTPQVATWTPQVATWTPQVATSTPQVATSTPSAGPSTGRGLSDRRKRRKGNPRKLVVRQDDPSDVYFSHLNDYDSSYHRSDIPSDRSDTL